MNTLKLLDNYWQLYKKNITLFFIFITVLHTIFFYYQLSVPFENPKFFMNIVMIFFNYFATFLVFFSTYKNLTFKFKTNTLLDFLFIMEIVNFTAYYILHNNDKWNTLIYMLYPTKLTKAILEDAIAVPWALEVIGFNLIIYVILHFFKITKGYEKFKFYLFIGYFFLTILLWFFSHFSYVGSNYIYMANNIKIVQTFVLKYIEKETSNNEFFDKKIKVYSSKEEFFNASKQEIEKLLTIQISEKNDKSAMLYNFNDAAKLKLFHDLIELKEEVVITHDIESVTDFNSWMTLVLNQYQMHYLNNEFYLTALTFPPKDQRFANLIKHNIFYMKEHNGKLYTYIDYDASFKTHNANAIFNVFYMLFHIVFWIFFIYLSYYHRKKVFFRNSNV